MYLNLLVEIYILIVYPRHQNYTDTVLNVQPIVSSICKDSQQPQSYWEFFFNFLKSSLGG